MAAGIGSTWTSRVRFPSLRMFPESFKMRHYLFLSVAHAVNKYVGRSYDPEEVHKGWHGWRARLLAEKIELPSQEELRFYTSDDELDPSNPRTRHVSEEWALPQQKK